MISTSAQLNFMSTDSQRQQHKGSSDSSYSAVGPANHT